MPTTVKLAKDPIEPCEPRNACWWRSSKRKLVTHRDSQSVKDGEEDTEERVKMPHSVMCEESEGTSVVTQSQVEQTRAATAEQELENALTQTLVTKQARGSTFHAVENAVWRGAAAQPPGTK